MACPLCYTPVLAAVGSVLGVPLALDARVGYGLTGAGGGAMLGVAYWRSSACPSKVAYLRLNRWGGVLLLAYATAGLCWESVSPRGPAPCCRTESASGLSTTVESPGRRQ